MQWEPVLADPLKSRAMSTALEIAEALLTRPIEPDRGSLSAGSAALTVLFHYLARAGARSDADAAAVRFLEQSMDAVAATPMSPALHEGFTGVAWAVAHVMPSQESDAAGDANEAVDAVLLELLRRRPWPGHYDLVGGLVGIGIYALERLPDPSGAMLLERIIERLEETAEHGPDGTTWKTRPTLLPEPTRSRAPNGFYNLGLAHGVPGVIGLLGAACAAGVAAPRARTLLEGAVAWLRSRRLPGESPSCFPAWSVPGTPPEPARSAWCYGDPGVAAALMVAARGAREPAWEREALAIARKAALRPPAESGVVDAGFCHGAAGLAHIFNRLYQATGDQVLLDAVRFWFHETLAMRQPGKGIAGFPHRAGTEGSETDWKAAPGLTNGEAGVALALLAACTAVEPAWDRIFLLSAPGVPAGVQPSEKGA